MQSVVSVSTAAVPSTFLFSQIPLHKARVEIAVDLGNEARTALGVRQRCMGLMIQNHTHTCVVEQAEAIACSGDGVVEHIQRDAT